MQRNLTLKIDDQLLKRVRHLAVEEDQSVSAWVARLIQRTLDEEDEYEQCRRQAMKHLRQPVPLGGCPISRETLHERR